MSPAAEMNSGSERLLKRAIQPATRRARAAFSLAEMMIALVILGLGLLFIAAALPAGLDYTRRTVDLATGEAAGEYALNTIEQYVRTSVRIAPGPSLGTPTRLDSLFRPRGAGGPALHPVDNAHEPFLKVRPLIGTNIAMNPGPGRYAQLAEAGERGDPSLGGGLIETFVPPILAVHPSYAGWMALPFRELDLSLASGWSLFQSPALPSVVRVYPPVSADDFGGTAGYQGFDPAQYFAAPYAPRRVLDPAAGGSETIKAADRRIVWTALYRRLSYNRTEPDTTVRQGDPLLYEFIVVVARRPTQNHRFPRQAATGSAPTMPVALPAATIGSELLFPEPWLVSFQNVPLVYNPGIPTWHFGDRELPTAFVDPPVIRLGCSAELARILRPGSILIPAVNDDLSAMPMSRQVGFIPHNPSALPIYEVQDVTVDPNNGANWVVSVRTNGIYPWISVPGNAPAWLCWVIPPAFEVRDSTGQPVYDSRSPVLSVQRRVIRVPEIPPS